MPSTGHLPVSLEHVGSHFQSANLDLGPQTHLLSKTRQQPLNLPSSPPPKLANRDCPLLVVPHREGDPIGDVVGLVDWLARAVVV